MNKKSEVIKVVPSNISSQSNLQGQVERIHNNNIVGWVQYKDDFTKTVDIDVYIDDEYLETISANLDTETIGVRNTVGHCGFTFPLPNEYLAGDKRLIKFVEHENQQTLPGSPFRIGNGSFDSEFTIENGQLLVGKIQQRTLDKTDYEVKLSLKKQLFWTQKLQGGDLQEIRARLPETVFDGKNHTVQIKIFDQSGRLSLMTMRKVKHSYRGLVEGVNFEKVSGWIANQEFPDIPVEIDLAINGEIICQAQCNIIRFDIQKKNNLASPQVGFEVDLPYLSALNTSSSIEIFIKGTKNRILSKQYVLTPKDIVIRSLISAAEHLNSLEKHQSRVSLSAGINTESNANTLVRQQIIAPIIKQLRQQPGLSANIKLAINPTCQIPVIEKSLTVDIIIPVYQGYDETIACINSVLTAKNTTPHQIIIINDQSPEGRLTYKLQAMAKEKLFILIENPKNLGFVATANIGMRLHNDRDVVLLNSDTEVYDGWLDRMQYAAQKNNNIATVTPFSNNATICSFPEFNQENLIETSAQQLNQWFAELNSRKTVDLPTAIGFCMLIKREAITTIGYFDEKTWQKGYGEENDFCLKASALGWRHILAADVYVKHVGSVSFSDSKQQCLETNLTKLNQLYPDYPVTVRRFMRQDPPAKYRNPVIRKLIQQQSEKHILFVMHNLGGGAKKNADQIAELLTQQGHSVLELVAISKTQWEIKDQTNKLCLKYQYPQDYKQLEEDLRELGIWRIHFHQLIGFSTQIWQLPEALSCAYDFTAHDFLPICPRINMIDESGRYCGESQYDNNKCQRCVQMNGLPDVPDLENLWVEYEQSLSLWREQYKQRLLKADNVFCPSQSTASIYKKHYALKNIKVKAHPESSFSIKKPALQAANNTINIALIGAIGKHKGSQLLVDCAKHALKEGLPLHFVLIGFSDKDKILKKLENVTITGKYEGSGSLSQHIKNYNCQLGLFLNVWPETFCYTLTEALENNLYPLALEYGAIAERIKALKFGIIMPANSLAKEINKAIMSAVKERETVKKELEYKGTHYKDILKDYYHVEKG
jgi:GT2 family glycosyltransferase/glycosyltransferase involved in cell wall biosynthesis